MTNVSDATRYDCFISFHGGQSLSSLSFPFSAQFPTVRHFVEFLAPRLANLPNRNPNVFLDSTELHDRIPRLFDAILQLRGGGLALVLLTTEYLQRKYCLAELRSFLRYAYLDESTHRASEAIVLRVVCLEPDRAGSTGVRTVLDAIQKMQQDPFAKQYVTGLQAYSFQTVAHDATAEVTAQKIIDHAWDYWRGPTRPNLGLDRTTSFLDMRRYFVKRDIPVLAAELGVEIDDTTELEHVFLQARRDHTVSVNDVSTLRNVCARCEKSEDTATSVASYERKWLSPDWSWSRAARDELTGYLDNATAAGRVLHAKPDSHDVVDDMTHASAAGGVFGESQRLPAAGRHLVIDFDDPNTPEGELLLAVKKRNQSCNFAAAIGAGGMGKSSAISRMIRSASVRDMFPGGIHFFEFGKDAVLERQTQKLVLESQSSGARIPPLELGSFAEKDNEAFLNVWGKVAKWFSQQNCLVALDDVWKNNERLWQCFGLFARILNDLESKCYVVLSTRQKDVAAVVPNVARVWFRPRAPLGLSSKRILASYAQCVLSELQNPDDRVKDAIESVLRRCAGIPLTLGVAGRLARQEADLHESPVMSTWNQISDRLETASFLLESSLDGYPSYFATVTASLAAADEFVKVNRPGLRLQPSELFIGLAVLQKQDALSAPALQLLWGLDDIDDVTYLIITFANFSLARKQTLGVEGGLRLHDLVHEYCRLTADNRDLTQTWARRMLKSCLVGDAASPKGCDANDTTPFSVDYWLSPSLVLDHYVDVHEVRLFLLARMESAIISIVHDYRWLLRWRNNSDVRDSGSIIALIDKYMACAEAVGNPKRKMPWGTAEVGEMMECLKVMVTAIRLAWGFVRINPAELPFQLSSRLQSCGSRLLYVGRFLESIERFSKEVYARPLSPVLLPAEGRIQVQVECSAEIGIALVPGTNRVLCAGESEISIVDLNLASKTAVLRDPEKRYFTLKGMEMFSNRGWVLSFGTDDFLRIWNLESGELDGRILAHRGGVRAVAISNDEEWIVSVGFDQYVRRWRAGSRQEVRNGIWRRSIYLKGVLSVAIDPGRKWFVCGCRRGMLHFWELHTGNALDKPIQVSKGPDARIFQVHVLGDGERLLVGISASGTRKVILWNHRLRERVWETEIHAASYDVFEAGNLLFVNQDADYLVAEIDLQSGLERRRHKLNDVFGRALRARNEHELLSGSFKLLSIYDLRGNELSEEVDMYCPNYFTWQSATDVPCKDRLLMDPGGELFLINGISSDRTEIQLKRPDNVWIECAAASSDGLWAVSSAIGGELRLWDLTTGSPVRLLPGSHDQYGIGQGIHVITISADDSTVGTGDSNGLVQIWDAKNSFQVDVLGRHNSEKVLGVTFARDGKTLASWGYDRLIRVWDVVSRRQIGAIPINAVGHRIHIRVTIIGSRSILSVPERESESEYWCFRDGGDDEMLVPARVAVEDMKSDHKQPVIAVIGRTVYWVSETNATAVASLERTCGPSGWAFSFRDMVLTFARQSNSRHIARIKIENG